MKSKILKKYVERYKALDWKEFEEFVRIYFLAKGWTDVKCTQRGNDKGRDVIGFKGTKKCYAEVKHHKSNIGRPVVQKLHSIVITEGADEGYVVTNSNFTKAAIAYAKKVGIILINGNALIRDCKEIMGEETGGNNLTYEIDLKYLVTILKNSVSRFIFYYTGNVLKKLGEFKYSSVIFSPIFIVKYSANQSFTNKSNNYLENIKINGDTLFIDRGTIKEIDLPYDLVNFQKNLDYLNKNNVKWSKTHNKSILSFPSIKKMKNAVQSVAQKQITYYGRNNQRYTKNLVLNLSNIEIDDYFIMWSIKGSVSSQIFRNKITINYRDSNSTTNFNSNKWVCSSCKKLIHENIPYRQICRSCGKPICKKCVNIQPFLIFFKKRWCKNCWKLVSEGTIANKKNKINRERFRKARAKFLQGFKYFDSKIENKINKNLLTINLE